MGITEKKQSTQERLGNATKKTPAVHQTGKSYTPPEATIIHSYAIAGKPNDKRGNSQEQKKTKKQTIKGRVQQANICSLI
jgi:hypothetical protein